MSFFVPALRDSVLLLGEVLVEGRTEDVCVVVSPDTPEKLLHVERDDMGVLSSFEGSVSCTGVPPVQEERRRRNEERRRRENLSIRKKIM